MIIALEDIQFTAYHGVYSEEKEHGNTFLVTVRLSLPDMPGVTTDALTDTVDYQSIYRLVADEMRQPSDLLEHVAGRIRASLLARWPSADVLVQIKKKNPPLGGPVAWASVTVGEK